RAVPGRAPVQYDHHHQHPDQFYRRGVLPVHSFNGEKVMIEVKDISRSYGEKIILDEVSVTIPKGKVTSLIGSNGAGKSTLLSIISRLLKQNGGTVLLDSRDIEAYKTRILAQHLSILKQANHV